ncbi:class I SAM-dependent methyltransferase [Streptomyces marispadix]|uniref:S-adenosyl-L-methionine-dependent methyltransferase n=1 Tax=Streptomyces marispadix TaxID=2922868 RepID=A0ABS9SXX9_9ACTN|nr:class I SAM-dependent methyltransferase [Streptomyces marispadix]MCH6161127.1 class I SAM-dependent methyltransferase [Streptomyces marispadix]
MQSGHASRSAMGSALLRAEHARYDPAPVLDDTLSGRLVPAAERPRLEKTIAGWPPQVRRSLRLRHALRARVAEDEAVAGLSVGRSDYVLLGSGLDTFAWRHPRAGLFRIWEVDHPDTQAWKRSALAQAAVAEAANVRFVPVDLVATGLGESGLPGHATWNWLGVTMYLPRAATRTTLRAIASRQEGTTLVADFVCASGELDEVGRAVRSSTDAAVAADGEPVLADYTTSEVRTLLLEAGFRAVTLLDAEALRSRYPPTRPDLCLSSSTVIAVATV